MVYSHSFHMNKTPQNTIDSVPIALFLTIFLFIISFRNIAFCTIIITNPAVSVVRIVAWATKIWFFLCIYHFHFCTELLRHTTKQKQEKINSVFCCVVDFSFFPLFFIYFAFMLLCFFRLVPVECTLLLNANVRWSFAVLLNAIRLHTTIVYSYAFCIGKERHDYNQTGTYNASHILYNE